MSTQSHDTHPETEKIQISLLKKASLSQRLTSVRSLSQSVILLSRRAISRANPGFNKSEVDIAFLEYHYGHELSKSVKEYLNKRKA
jgi:hypothetical protein